MKLIKDIEALVCIAAVHRCRESLLPNAFLGVNRNGRGSGASGGAQYIYIYIYVYMCSCVYIYIYIHNIYIYIYIYARVCVKTARLSGGATCLTPLV